MAATIEILSDKMVGYGIESNARRCRIIHGKTLGLGTVEEVIVPVLSSEGIEGFAITVKNIGAQALSGFECRYCVTENINGACTALDDAKDHWEIETGMKSLAAGVAKYAHMAHTPPAHFALTAKTGSGETDLEWILDIEMKW